MSVASADYRERRAKTAVPEGPPIVAQVLAPGLLLLGPQGVALVARALDVAAGRAARDGIALPPQAQVLRAALVGAGSGFGTSSHAGAGTSEPAARADRARSGQDVTDAEGVAQVLKVSREYACRLLRDGAFTTAHKVAGRWQVDRLDLHARRDERQEARTA